MSTTEPDQADHSSGAGFCRINRHIWARLCDSGSFNAAAAYLVLACGTGRSNSMSTWGATSVAKYAGMRWNRASEAIEQVMKLKVIAHTPEHTTLKPRYKLRTWREITGPEPVCYPTKKREKQEAELQAIGPDEDLIWLPNTLVTGTDAGEDSPIHKLRQGGDIWSLRTLVDFYHAQNLRDDGGISPQVLRQNFEVRKVGERGTWSAWAFRATGVSHLWSDTKPFLAHKSRPEIDKSAAAWDSVRALERHGLLTFVPHVWENETAEAEIIHPFGLAGYIGGRLQNFGEPIEIEIRAAAQQAAYVVGNPRLIEAAEVDGFHHFCPVRQTIPAPAMIGIARLRYRPHTRRTASWYGELQATAAKWIAEYNQITTES